jgi:hypothetical protein
MEGIQTINALKAVVSSLPAQTTIPSSELVMLYAADGTPIAKIARDDLVKAVASVMASNSQNTFSKLLGVQANGTPMGIGASDLASVLGESVSFRKILNGAHVTIGDSVVIDNREVGMYFLIDYACFCVYLVFRAGSWQTVVGTLESLAANGYDFSIDNGNLVASHGREGANNDGSLHCWEIG